MNIKQQINNRLKEADLYVQQGLFEEAAGIYKKVSNRCRSAIESNRGLSDDDLLILQDFINSIEKKLILVETQSKILENHPEGLVKFEADLSAEKLFKRGVLFKNAGFYRQAIGEFERSMGKNPNLSLKCFREMADAKVALGDRDEGIRLLQHALPFVRGNPDEEASILEKIAVLQEGAEHKQEALATYREIIQRHETYGRIFRKIEELTSQLADSPLNIGIVCRYPKLFFTAFLILALFFSAFNPFVQTVNNVDYFELEDNPEVKFYDHFKSIFGDDEFFVIAFESSELFSPKDLEMIQGITASLENLSDVKKVTSLTNVNDISGGEDYFEVSQFIEEIPETKSEQNTLKTRALQNPLYVDNLISKNGLTTAIVVEPEVRPEDQDLRKRLLAEVWNILAPYETQETQFYLAGDTTTNYYLAKYLNTDSLIFVPVTYLLITFVTWLIFRSKTLTLLSIINISFCVGATRGLMGLMGISVNNITTIIIPLVMALALCDTVHIFSHLENSLLKKYGNPKKAVTHIINQVSLPCFLTTLTTAVGFASLYVSEIKAIKEFGMVASAGMVFEFLFSFFLLPPLILFCKPKYVFLERTPQNGITSILSSLFSYLFRWYPIVVLTGIIIVIGAAVFASQIRIETNVVEFFKKNSPVRTSLNFVERHLTGVETLDVSFQASERDAFKKPENLLVIETVQNYIKNLNGIDKTMSFIDFIKDMNQSFHSESQDYYRIPDSKELVSQYMLMYDADDIEDYINADFDHARLAIRSSHHSSIQQQKLIHSIRDYLKQINTNGLDVRVTGNGLKLVLEIDSLVKSQIYSLGLAAIVIIFTLLIVFRSIGLAALSIIPNFFPILLNFGVMGLMGIPLDTGTSLIAAVALGIAVDDTIHFLTEYQKQRAQGEKIRGALMKTVEVKGKGLTSSSIILSIGFGVMVLSRFVPIIHFGLLCAIIMITALVADIVLMPAVILLKKEKHDEGGIQDKKPAMSA